MIAEGTTKYHQPHTLAAADEFVPTREELIRCVESKTYQQIEDLDIQCRGSRVRVSGRSSTYYVKQLVTHAILTSIPAAKLENDICVQAS